VLIGAATDILDGKAARRYLGKDREGKLGKYDLEVDTLFFLCVIGYLSLSDIVIPTIIGLSWISLAVITIVLYRRKPKILLLFEVPTIVALLVVAGVYNLEIFTLIVAPAMIIGLIINRKRVLYLIFEYWPRVFSE
jgi:phosphatidylglycerophosphate synthase